MIRQSFIGITLAVIISWFLVVWDSPLSLLYVKIILKWFKNQVLTVT